MRLDQWLWAVRLFKTRSLAVEAIRGGRVKIEGSTVKPSREVRAGEIISASTGSSQRIVKVRQELPLSRVGAKLVALYYDDLTPPPPEETQPSSRPRGAGRPTKKERRQLDHWASDELE